PTLGGLLPLGLVALYLFARRTRRDGPPLRSAARLAGVGGLAAAVAVLNDFPLALADAPSPLSWSARVAAAATEALTTGAGYATMIAVAAIAGSALYRARFPNRPTPEESLSWRGVTSDAGAWALWLGGMLAFAI